MVMLQTVIRPSMERSSTAEPAYSMTYPVPPAVPISPMTAKIRSLATTPVGKSPSTVMRMFFSGICNRVCVANTCSTSVVPMPNASDPKAPCVAVWLSPQTSVVPGRVKPCSGPMMWTIPWRMSFMSNSSTPNSAQFLVSASIWMRLSSSSMPWERSVVGTLWSATASVRSARRTLRPAARSPSNACGLVTSWIRWRSI